MKRGRMKRGVKSDTKEKGDDDALTHTERKGRDRLIDERENRELTEGNEKEAWNEKGPNIIEKSVFIREEWESE